MALIYWGEVDAASDITMSAIVETANSRTRDSILELIAPLAAAIIANDPTIIAGAENAVAAVLAAEDVVVGGDARLLDATDLTTHRVVDSLGRVAFRIDERGDAEFTHDLTLSGVEVKRSRGFKVRDRERRIALHVDPNTGKTYIYDPVLVGHEGATGSNRLIVDILAGQSNMEGRGRPFSAELDPQDARHYMFDWESGEIVTATVPLSSQQQQIGLSMGTVIARETLASEPVGTVVVTINTAAGGSGLISDPVQGNWGWGYAGANPRLASIMVSTVDAALVKIAEMFPALTPIVRFWWHQGEADTDGPAYQAAFDTLVSNYRAHLALPDMPVVIGGLVPEYIAANPTREAIRAVHIDTPRRLTRTAYADGVVNGGGSGSVTDIVHYAREGVVRLGERMYSALTRALTNTPTSVPVPPKDVTVRLADGVAVASWSAPWSRVTDYVVEYSTDQVAWTAVTGRPVALDTTASIPTATPVWVRVSTVNEVGTSAPSTPVRSNGV